MEGFPWKKCSFQSSLYLQKNNSKMNQIIIDDIVQISLAAKDFIEKTKGLLNFAFYGEMGAGKTTFIKALCKELGAKDAATSPSFSIVNEYTCENNFKIFHFDFYRINNIEEAFDIGVEEYFYSDSFCFIEWPEKILSILPDDVLQVHINVLSSTKREIIF